MGITGILTVHLVRNCQAVRVVTGVKGERGLVLLVEVKNLHASIQDSISYQIPW
jgi:hypothetical protein